MAQGRMLKRKITRSKKLAALKTDKARLLWFYMLPFTDVDGRIEADAEDIRDEIIRKQRKGFSVAKIEDCLQDLHRVGLIVLYSVNSQQYLEFTKFSDEQNLRRDKEAESDIPAPSTGEVRAKGGTDTAVPTLSLSKVKLSKDKEKALFLDFIYLTKEEHQKLITRYGGQPTSKMIKSMNLYLGSKGDKYKSHYYTLLNWARRDGIKEIIPTEEADPKAEVAALEHRKEEIRKEDGPYFQEKTIEQLKIMRQEKKHLARRWLIDEILTERT